MSILDRVKSIMVSAGLEKPTAEPPPPPAVNGIDVRLGDGVKPKADPDSDWEREFEPVCTHCGCVDVTIDDVRSANIRRNLNHRRRVRQTTKFYKMTCNSCRKQFSGRTTVRVPIAPEPIPELED